MTVVVPATIEPALAVIVHEPPNVQICPLTDVEELVRSALDTRPVAVSEPVTIKPGAVTPVGMVVALTI